jgi:hypothetical protein
MEDIKHHTGVHIISLTKMIVDRIVELQEVKKHKTVPDGL